LRCRLFVVNIVFYICRITAMRLTTPTLLVLAALLRDPELWRYGYDLSAETTLKSGCLYPILVRLKERGWLQSKWQYADNQKPRHMYRFTALGQCMARQVMRNPQAVTKLDLAEQG
jgi:PadR family transcriptional regulator, regulatory protein PadR